MSIKQFNIRAYGIWINEKNQVLVADELVKQSWITKFPGGGLEFGEGLIDCIKREFMEELNLRIEVLDHFYTTDFFQQSAFHKDHQIISVYYLIKPISTDKIAVKEKLTDFKPEVADEQKVRWISLDEISATDFTLPIDKIVGDLLAQKKKQR
ncbi:MAG TPA: NUDIX hydrolase [Bacteroidia bacterium]|jgi:ADP-ribose pyrophosphatase YjhB (NUDIX family)|nr:NUDIX hydrolase [Bacteroidia bacterium]